MMEVAWESFPDFRRYLKAKARALEVNALAWFDLFAPVGGEERTWGYKEANEFIVEHFGSYSPKSVPSTRIGSMLSPEMGSVAEPSACAFGAMNHASLRIMYLPLME
jgi:hypothetical protein